MENLNHYDRIQDFISGKLTKDQQDKFKSDLNNKPDLELEYKATLATEHAIELLGAKRLKRKFNAARELNQPLKVHSKRSSNGLWVKIAAAIAFLIIASTIAFFYLQNPSPTSIAQEGFTEPPLLSLRTPNKGQKQSPLSIGEYAYDQQELTAAINVLSKVEENDKDFILAQLTLGATYFKQQKYDLAIEVFTKLGNTANSYKQQADWNLAMAYLAKQDVPKARQLLLQIDKEGNITDSRKQKLSKILKQLE